MENTTAEQTDNAFAERRITVETVKHSPEEQNAILHFYKDKRFTITE